ncbi:MAG: (2Fe-2S)-binding protein [Betaproteobacteria bacterium]|nr:(2Fe-2S)-binding protein [Betaproteobacteria bacterium]
MRRRGATTSASEIGLLKAHCVTLSVNGQKFPLTLTRAATLLHTLRNDLHLNGPRYGCGLGQCGACTVLIDDRAARSCVIPAVELDGRTITTLEGLAEHGRLHPVQEAFIEAQAAQCGYCLNGMIMTTVALLRSNPDPSEFEVRQALAGNLCRCGTHLEILDAVKGAVQRGVKRAAQGGAQT